MANPIKIGLLPVTKQIVVGRVNEKTGMWVGERTDVTDDALGVVADYLKSTNQELIFKDEDKKYKLKVIEVTDHEAT